MVPISPLFYTNFIYITDELECAVAIAIALVVAGSVPVHDKYLYNPYICCCILIICNVQFGNPQQRILTMRWLNCLAVALAFVGLIPSHGNICIANTDVCPGLGVCVLCVSGPPKHEKNPKRRSLSVRCSFLYYYFIYLHPTRIQEFINYCVQFYLNILSYNTYIEFTEDGLKATVVSTSPLHLSMCKKDYGLLAVS